MSTIICFVVFSAGYPSVQPQRKKATLISIKWKKLYL
jgi:hypothetical protein